MQPRFSPGTDETSTASALAPLLASSGGRWTLSSEGKALERSFKFKTFAKTWDFMTAVSLQCKLKNHHPEWSNFWSDGTRAQVYNTTFIRWTTHNPLGLSEKDARLAGICDALAKDFGELDPEPASREVKGLADKAASSSGDCCAPRKEK
ncbi:Pterin-4-alpha-carbinolamine dehydratase [Metarhizium anisopliae]|nr:Pterin-4-alpha-carbinolamine dehydratase [Metarhizium anisopliae]